MANMTINGLIEASGLGGGIGRKILDLVYPVGILVEFAANTDPNSIMLGQKWELYGAGKTTVCQDSGTFKTLGASVGAETITLTTAQMPAHNHSFSLTANTAGKHKHGIRYQDSFRLGGNAWANGNGTNGTNDAYCVEAGEHTHTISGTINNAGSGSAHSNIQPSIIVKRWQRTA